METIKDKILKKKEEIKELKNEFLKENVGNVFCFSDVEYQNNNSFNGGFCNSISCRYIYVYENDGEVLTKHIIIKHITRSNPSGYSNGFADWKTLFMKRYMTR